MNNTLPNLQEQHMAEHKVKGGCTLTDEEIARLGEACDRGDYPGEPGDWIVHPKRCVRPLWILGLFPIIFLA